ncbi:MAG TPA: GTPase domain-containing protein [Vicinamibacteria bacterium]|nr:GTPase domain-containing protein [Vicinamibacteria bacterium]
MVEYNRQERVVKVKIAYYGPAVGGKTTNLKVLYERARRGRRGEFVSVNSQQDRTILCDLLPLKSVGFRGLDLRFQLAAVPGQAIYAPARRVVLRGSDGVVFVANSATDRWHENVQSFRELQGHLLAQELDPATIPMVLQYNKRDLPDLLDVETLDRGLNARRVPTFPAVATRGEGVLETFAEIIRLTLADVTRRHPALSLPEGQTVDEWAEMTVLSMFGAAQLAGGQSDEEIVSIDLPEEALFGEEGSTRHLLRVSMPEDAGRTAAATPDSASAAVLAETYAQASTELGQRVTELREERDVARHRLAEVRVALQLAEQKAEEGEVEDRAQRILGILMRSAGASNASLLLTTTDPPQILVLPPLVSDPLARTRWGALHLHELRDLAETRVEEGGALPELAEALRQAEPVFESVTLVPLRSAERGLALAVLYYLPHVMLPTPETLQHVGFLGRVLAGPLEAAAAREATASAHRMRAVSHASASAMASLLTRLPPGSARRAALPLEDVLAAMRVPGVTVTVAPGTPPVSGDASLLRYAVATLVVRCEAVALERSTIPVIGVYAGLDEGFVRIHVWLGEGAAVVGAPVVTQAFAADADTEMTAVYAIMALHEGYLVTPESESGLVHYVLQLSPAAS